MLLISYNGKINIPSDNGRPELLARNLTLELIEYSDLHQVEIHLSVMYISFFINLDINQSSTYWIFAQIDMNIDEPVQ